MPEFKAVRCGSDKATPYLRKHVDLFTEWAPAGHVIDIGCGEGRNSRFLKDRGMHVMSLDGKGDYGIKWMAGDKIPAESGTADCILCNYFLMFLSGHARNDVYGEINRVSHKGTRLLIELEMVKQSLTPDEYTLNALNEELRDAFRDWGWKIIQKHKNRYIFGKC